ncbi:MAG: GNAT family N-acetyltransferase [Candidatus Aenigmarchaeota archaeon]|nr:GNAT family N-acetyltransferase [Candidatus Aenigmarchaeota archaeon]
MIKIRKAVPSDFEELYEIGLKTPELSVSSDEPFMDKDDFRLRIRDRHNVFLLAEDKGKIVGYVLADGNDADRPLRHRYACIIYLVVIPSYRKRGIAKKLFDACIARLKTLGITHVYAWANAHSAPIQKFLVNHGFKTGKKYIWMDRKIQ